MPVPSAALRNDTHPPRSGYRGKRVSIDKLSGFERKHPVLFGIFGLLILRVFNFLACMTGGLLIFVAAWFVYANLPLISPAIFSYVSELFWNLPSDTARMAIPLAAFIIFVGVVPPIVIGGIVLPAVMAVMSWRDKLSR